MKFARLTKLLAALALALLFVSTTTVARERPKDEPKKEVLYPDTTRAEPELDLTKARESEKLNEGLDAVNNDDAAKATEILQPFAEGTASKSRYAQALALQGLANLKYNNDDMKGAIDLLQKSLAIGVMPNDTYFQLKFQLAQFYLIDEQYQKALTTITEWRNEGKRETADSYALEGNAYYRLERYPEAIAAIKKAMSLTDQPKDSWNQLLAASYAESGDSDQALKLAQEQLAANPSDTTTLRNTIALLVQAQKYPEALKLMEQARSSGTFTDEKDYVNMAKLYLVIGQDSDEPKPYTTKAVAVLEEGMTKGIVKPSYEVYKLQGDAAYIGNDKAAAIAAYQKAAPLATDGEADFRRGQLLIEDGKYSEGKKALTDAISKGVKHTGSAYMQLAEAERATKNKSAAVAAMKKATEDPETRSRAQEWLQKAGQ